jgi:hypothetical protein
MCRGLQGWKRFLFSGAVSSPKRTALERSQRVELTETPYGRTICGQEEESRQEEGGRREEEVQEVGQEEGQALGRFTHRALLEQRSARYDEKEPRGLLATRGALTVSRPRKTAYLQNR